MTKDLFAKKIMTLRKKHHLTQQELADKLNISNKTVSRWETGESYPDIELLPEIAEIFHVSIDYLLTDRENIHDLEKSDIVGYLPCAIGMAAVFLYYFLQKIDIPGIFCLMIYLLMIKFSYQFYDQYTARNNGDLLVKLNTVTGFFVTQSIISQILITLITVSQFGLTFAFFSNNVYYDNSTYPAQLALSFICSVILAGIYAYWHYQKHIKEITSA